MRLDQHTKMVSMVSTTCIYLKLSAVLNDNSLGSGSALTSHGFNLVHDIQALGDFSKDNMATIQPRGIDLYNR